MATTTNQFEVLGDEIEEHGKGDSTGSDFAVKIAEAVKLAIAHLGDSGKEDGVVKSQKESSVNGSMIGNIVTAVIVGIQPLVNAAIRESATTRAVERVCGMPHASEKVKSVVQREQWGLDALEQYSRRDNVKIYGVPEAAQSVCEDTNQVVIVVIVSVEAETDLGQLWPSS